MIRFCYRCPADFTGGEILGEGVNGAAVQKIRDFKTVVFYLGRGLTERGNLHRLI
jgi:hypothetical protein